MPYTYDLTGQYFGRLVVLSRSYPGKGWHQYWNCQCDCGVEKRISQDNLLSQRTKSCGCLRREATRQNKERHGHTRDGKRSATHATWSSMIARCTNPSNTAYPDYGGRGVGVCERWLVFENFLEDMGPRPNGYTLDRIDNNHGYNVDNCRWASHRQQANNRRSNRIITVDGISLNIRGWSELNGIKPQTIQSRLSLGWDPVDAVSTPVDYNRKLYRGGKRRSLTSPSGQPSTAKST